MSDFTQLDAGKTNEEHAEKALGLLKLTLLYVAAEFYYHLLVLKAASTPGLTSAEAHLLEAVGCTLAAWGFVLLIKRVVGIGAGLGVLLVAALGSGLYLAIDRAIDWVPLEAKTQAESLAKQKVVGLQMHYELALLEGERYDGSFEHRAMLGHGAILVMRDADAAAAGLKALQGRSVTVGQELISPLVAEYQTKTLRLLNHCARACSPAVLVAYNRLTPEQRKRHAIGKRYGHHIARVSIDVAGVQLNGFSVPLGLTPQAFTAWVDQRAREKVNQVAATPMTPEQVKQAVRAVWFTPVALTLSLISVLLNLASAMGLLTAVLLSQATARRWVASLGSVVMSAVVLFLAIKVLLPAATDDFNDVELTPSRSVLLAAWEQSRAAEMRMARWADEAWMRLSS